MSLASYVEARCIPEPNSGCWLWLLAIDSSGYGRGEFVGKKDRAHRLSYQAFKGAIPDGLTIDHLCRNKCCVNPDHLDAVTLTENIRRRHTAAGNQRHDGETREDYVARLRTYTREYHRKNSRHLNDLRNARRAAERARV
jgi:hypothetical protein